MGMLRLKKYMDLLATANGEMVFGHVSLRVYNAAQKKKKKNAPHLKVEETREKRQIKQGGGKKFWNIYVKTRNAYNRTFFSFN